MANEGCGDGRVGERIVRTVERIVVTDEIRHRQEFQRDATENPYTLGPTGSEITSRTGRI